MPRGDSGLTDSQFMEAQKLMQRKQEIYIKKKEEAYVLEQTKKRFNEASNSPKKKNLWEIIKELF